MTKQVTYTRKEKNATTPFMCVVCQKPAEGRKGSKFCSNTCKQRDKNLRAKDKIEEIIKIAKDER